MPGSDWPLQSTANGTLASLSTVGVGGSSTALLDDGDGTPYWLVMETSGTGGFGDSVFDFWYRSLTATNPFRAGALVVGGLQPPNPAGNSPAYSLTFIGTNQVPEPSTAVILSLGCAGGLLLRRRRAA